MQKGDDGRKDRDYYRTTRIVTQFGFLRETDFRFLQWSVGDMRTLKIWPYHSDGSIRIRYSIDGLDAQ